MDTEFKERSGLFFIGYKRIDVSFPMIHIDGMNMQFICLPEGEEYYSEPLTVANILRGKVNGEGQYKVLVGKGLHIYAEERSLVFLCQDTSPGIQKTYGELEKEMVKGISLPWIEPAPRKFRTDPKIEIDRYRINLWRIAPFTNGGIHNHALQQGHNTGDRFVEFHTQLRGSGKIIEYAEQREGTEKREYPMDRFGDSHPIMCRVKNGVPVYPWHAYVSGPQGALFVAFEDMAYSF